MADHMAESERRTRVPRARVDASPEPEVREGFANYLPHRDAAAPEGAAGQSTPATDEAAEPRGAAKAGAGVRTWLHETFPGHENAVAWGFAGFLLALLFFAIGFWRTVLVVVLVVAGVAFGQALDGDPKIVNALRSLFNGDNGR